MYPVKSLQAILSAKLNPSSQNTTPCAIADCICDCHSRVFQRDLTGRMRFAQVGKVCHVPVPPVTKRGGRKNRSRHTMITRRTSKFATDQRMIRGINLFDYSIFFHITRMGIYFSTKLLDLFLDEAPRFGTMKKIIY